MNINIDSYKSFYLNNGHEDAFQLAQNSNKGGRFSYAKSTSLISQTQKVFEEIDLSSELDSASDEKPMGKAVYSAVVMSHYLTKERHANSNMFMRAIYKIVDFFWGVNKQFDQFVSEYKEKYELENHLDLMIMDTLEAKGHTKASDAMLQDEKAKILYKGCTDRTKQVLKQSDAFTLLKKPSVKLSLAHHLENLNKLNESSMVSTLLYLVSDTQNDNREKVLEFLTKGILDSLKEQATLEKTSIDDLVSDHSSLAINHIIYTANVEQL